jgi:hypothetical protein
MSISYVHILILRVNIRQHLTEFFIIHLQYIQDVSTILGQTSGVSAPHQNKKISWNQYITAKKIIGGWAPTFARPECFRFLSLKTLENSRIFSCNWKLSDALLTHFLFLSNYSKPPLDLGKSATFHDQTCSHAHLYRRRPLPAFIANCGLINIKSWTVATM